VRPDARLITGKDLAADRAAARLARIGVRPGMVVPVLLPRSPEMVAALLGLTRLGAGYAALDVRWPDERVRRICSMLNSPVVVTDEPSRVEQATWNPMDPPDDKHTFRPWREDLASAGPASPDDVFCVFFTSGSTGEPKGIPATRRAVTGLLRPGGLPLRLSRSTVMTVAAPTPWDMFAFELWGPLLNAGTCILMEENYLTPGRLRENVARYGQDTVWLTSSLFNMFVEEDAAAFAGLTQVVTGGERLSPNHVREFLLAHPGIRLFNDYGPAENPIASTIHEVSPDDCGRPDGIPIGRPENMTTVWILDGERVCRPGELGEICLAGPRLSPGYLGDPGLTARAFVTIELNGRPTRTYRTGDLGWRDEEGIYHFHGRADRQVKVRGHRIEPAEIERRIAAHPSITGCAVVPLTGSGGTVAGLTACYQARHAVTDGELRAYLRGRLPGYLVPDRWLRVDHIPLLGNGKADLGLLGSQAQRASENQLPHDRVPLPLADRLLADVQVIVGETAGLGAVPPDAPLFEAGANSLQLIRACVRAAQRWRVRIEPAEFFRRPTARHLAQLIRSASPAHTQPRGARAQGKPLRSVQYAMLVAEAVGSAHPGAWNCTLAWRIEGTADERALRLAAGRVHRRHPLLHAQYPAVPSLQSAAGDRSSSPGFAVLACGCEEEAWARLDEALHVPFRLSQGPVWRVVLVTVNGRDTALLGVAVHHVAFDDWSEHILARDLAAAYASELSGASGHRHWSAEPLPWPVEEPAAGSGLEEQRRMLAEELTGTPPLAFPAGPEHVAHGGAAGRITRTLSAAQTGRCFALASEHATTPFVIGLAAYAAAASRLTGRTDFPVAVPVAQRTAENEDAVGCLINLLCLRLRLPAATGEPRALMAAAKRAAHLALLTQDVPFPEAVSLLRPREDTGGLAVPYLFAVQQDALPVLDLPGCRTSLRRLPQHDTGFEFQLELRLPGEQQPGEIAVTYRRDAVTDAFASSLTSAFTDFIGAAPVRRLPAGRA
jgi:amino acid adenylation domain-containing protein